MFIIPMTHMYFYYIYLYIHNNIVFYINFIFTVYICLQFFLFNILFMGFILTNSYSGLSFIFTAVFYCMNILVIYVSIILLMDI